MEWLSARYNGTMIRKAIVVALVLGAFGIAVGNVLDGKRTVLHGAGIFRDPRIAVSFAHWQLMLFYVVADDPRKPDLHLSWTRIGFRRARMYRQSSNTYSETMYVVYCPSLIVIGCLAAYPVVVLIRRPARRRCYRREHSLCVTCGYDLTGNVSGVCPECGTKVEQP